MRDGYGKNKLFFIVVLSIVGIMLMPYGIFGMSGRSMTRGQGESGKSQETGSGENMEETGAADKTNTADTAEATGMVNPADSMTEVMDSVVEITVKDAARNVIYASGNGVVLENKDGEICLVTAAHVLERAGTDGKVLVGFRDREKWAGTAKTEVECNRYEIVADADLAFLFLAKGQIGETDTVPICGKSEYDRLQAGDIVRTIGWDEEQKVIYEGELQESWIFVENFSQYMMLAECVLRPGMSGCGLYNSADQLIGIACGGNEEGQIVAVPLHIVQARYSDFD